MHFVSNSSLMDLSSMDINLNFCSTEEIANFLLLANKDLQQSLIYGADWEELKEKRFVVTELQEESRKISG